jgi:NADPH:quinone reductase-like Zn-dependent oxidoreductase
MQAVVQHEYGTDPAAVLRVEERDRPPIGADAVQVHVRAASVDQGTWHLMAGLPYLIRLTGFLGLRGPKVSNPGRCFAGTVTLVGANVAALTPGDDVYGTCDASFAEYVAAPAKQVARMPANLSFDQAAAAPISGVTALEAVRDAADVQAGESVLVIGASGGVGTFAVQVAKAFGANVVAVCSPAKADFVRALGADAVIDYTREDFTDGSRRYDVILDIGGHTRLSRLRRALTKQGRLVIVGGETDGKWVGGFDRSLRAPLLSLFVSQKLSMLVSSEKTEHLDALRGLVEAGQVTPMVDRVFPLAETAAAIRYLRDGHARGKIVVAVGSAEGTSPSTETR